MHALPRLFVLMLVTCCYRLFHAQDMVVATHDCGPHRRAHLPSELGEFPSSVTLPPLVFVTFALLTIKTFSSSSLAPQPGSNRPFRRPSPLPLSNPQSFSPKCVSCVQLAHGPSRVHLEPTGTVVSSPLIAVNSPLTVEPTSPHTRTPAWRGKEHNVCLCGD